MLSLQIRILESMAFDQVIGCQPLSRQSDRGLLSELESLVTYRDRKGTSVLEAVCKSCAGEPTNTILQEPPQPNQVQHSLKETTQHRGHCTKLLFCVHTPLNSNLPVPRAGIMTCCHHIIPGEMEAIVQQVRNLSSTDDLSYSCSQ